MLHSNNSSLLPWRRAHLPLYSPPLACIFCHPIRFCIIFCGDTWKTGSTLTIPKYCTQNNIQMMRRRIPQLARVITNFIVSVATVIQHQWAWIEHIDSCACKMVVYEKKCTVHKSYLSVRQAYKKLWRFLSNTKYYLSKMGYLFGPLCNWICFTIFCSQFCIFTKCRTSLLQLVHTSIWETSKIWNLHYVFLKTQTSIELFFV